MLLKTYDDLFAMIHVLKLNVTYYELFGIIFL